MFESYFITNLFYWIRLLAEKAFTAFVGLFVLSSVLGAFIFNQYASFIEDAEPQTIERFEFKSQTYQDIIKIWEEQEKTFKETDSKQYPNFFVPHAISG